MSKIACPRTDATVLTATTAGTARVQLSAGQGFNREPFIVHNPGGAVVRIKVGSASVTATATSFPIGPGETQAIDLGDENTHMAAWVAASTQDLHIFDAKGV